MERQQHPIDKVIASGPAAVVSFVVRENGRCPGEEFFNEECARFRTGPKKKPNATAQAHFAALFDQMARVGTLPDGRFGPEGDGLYAFKAELNRAQFRFACFQDGRKWVITHGFQKPGAQKKRGVWPPEQIDRAKELRGVYWDRMKKAALRVVT